MKYVWKNRPFVARHSRGTKPLCWRANVALGQDKERKLLYKYVFCLPYPSATFALQHGFFGTKWMASCPFNTSFSKFSRLFLQVIRQRRPIKIFQSLVPFTVSYVENNFAAQLWNLFSDMQFRTPKQFHTVSKWTNNTCCVNGISAL